MRASTQTPQSFKSSWRRPSVEVPGQASFGSRRAVGTWVTL
jgi:hypothetical protein